MRKWKKNRKMIDGNATWCSSCKKTNVPLLKYSKVGNAQYYMCCNCNKKRRRDYYYSKTGKQNIIRINREYEKRNPQRRKTWAAARVIKKEKCIICGVSNVHRHHPDPRLPLKVLMLCPLHHRKVHTSKNSLEMV